MTASIAAPNAMGKQAFTKPQWPWWSALILSLAFLTWHQPWFAKPLSGPEVEAALARANIDKTDRVSEAEKVRLRAFLANDDGRPFYNINLMLYRDKAQYRDAAKYPGIVTGAQAAQAYGDVVLPLLLQRGSYPVFVSSKITNMLEESAPGADFFQEIAVVRYRSRRDMLDMVTSPQYLTGVPHKFASLEKNVAVPAMGFVTLDATLVVPLLLFGLAALLVNLRSSRPTT